MERHRQMTIFQAVASEFGLAAASRRLGISEATVSRALAALERRLGTPLLKRSTRGVMLTDAGRQFAADCARVLRATDEADASAKGHHVEPRGLLTLATPLLFGDQLLMPVVLDYLDAWPDVQICVIYLDRFPNLHEEGVDVAVLIGDLPDGYLAARRIGAVRQMICASPDYLRHRGEPRTPSDLTGHALVMCSGANRSMDWRFQVDGAVRSLALKPGLRCSTPLAVINAAVSGAGLASCLHYPIQEHLEAGRLQPVLEAFEQDPLPLHLVYREGFRASAKVRSFVDFATERLRRHPVLSA